MLMRQKLYTKFPITAVLFDLFVSLNLTCGLRDHRALFACISRWMARSLYARANFSGLWLLLLLNVTSVCSMEVRKASTGSKNSKSLSGSGKRSLQLSTMLSSVLNKKLIVYMHVQLLIMEKTLIHGVIVLFKTYTVEASLTATSLQWPPLEMPFFSLGRTFTLQPLSRPPRDNDNGH